MLPTTIDGQVPSPATKNLLYQQNTPCIFQPPSAIVHSSFCGTRIEAPKLTLRPHPLTITHPQVCCPPGLS